MTHSNKYTFLVTKPSEDGPQLDQKYAPNEIYSHVARVVHARRRQAARIRQETELIESRRVQPKFRTLPVRHAFAGSLSTRKTCRRRPKSKSATHFGVQTISSNSSIDILIPRPRKLFADLPVVLDAGIHMGMQVYTASWFSNSPNNAQTGQISTPREVFGKMLLDPILYVGFSTVCRAFSIASVASSSSNSQQRRDTIALIKAKISISGQLRDRMRRSDADIDVIVLSIVVLMGIDLVDMSLDYDSVTKSWASHMRGIDQILNCQGQSGVPRLSAHANARLSAYVEFLRHLESADPSDLDGHTVEFAHFVTWPKGLAACYLVDSSISSAGTIIDSVAAVKSAVQQGIEGNKQSDPLRLVEAARKALLQGCVTLFHVSRRKKSPIVEIFLLGLVMYAQHVTHTLTGQLKQASGETHSRVAPPLDPLFSIRCTIWACHPQLSILLPNHVASRAALCWIGCLLRGTLAPRHPGAQLGHRLVSICMPAELYTNQEDLLAFLEQHFWWDKEFSARFATGS